MYYLKLLFFFVFFSFQAFPPTSLIPEKPDTAEKEKDSKCCQWWLCITGKDHRCLHLCTDLDLLIQNWTLDPQQETYVETNDRMTVKHSLCFHNRSRLCQVWPEVSEASALLQSLSKHLVLADVVVTDGAPSESHGLFKVIPPDLRNRIKIFILLTEKEASRGRQVEVIPFVKVCVCVPSPKAESYKTLSRPLGNQFISHALCQWPTHTARHCSEVWCLFCFWNHEIKLFLSVFFCSVL